MPANPSRQQSHDLVSKDVCFCFQLPRGTIHLSSTTIRHRGTRNSSRTINRTQNGSAPQFPRTMASPRPLTVGNLMELQSSPLPRGVVLDQWAVNRPPPTIDPRTGVPLPPRILMVPPRLAPQVATPPVQHVEETPRAAFDSSTEPHPSPAAVPVSCFRSTIPTPVAPRRTVLARTRQQRDIPRTAISPVTATAPRPDMFIPTTTGIIPPPPTKIEDVHEVAAQGARALLSNPRRFRIDPGGSFREPMTDAEMEDPFFHNDCREWHTEQEGVHWSPYRGDCVPSRWGVRRHLAWYWIRTRIFGRDRTVQAWRLNENGQMQRRAFRL